MKDYEKLSRNHFNKQAADYDLKDSVYYSKYPKISCRDVAQRLNNVPYRSLLDIGCGTGFLIELLQKQKKAEYYGLDLSPEMLKIAKAKFNGVIFTEGSASDLPYEDSSFDIVTCIQSFHHYPHPEKAMREAYRVLKKGGLYILSDTGMGGPAKWFYNNFLLKRANSGDYAMYTKKDIEVFMSNYGFSVITSDKIHRFIYTVIGKKQ